MNSVQIIYLKTVEIRVKNKVNLQLTFSVSHNRTICNRSVTNVVTYAIIIEISTKLYDILLRGPITFP